MQDFEFTRQLSKSVNEAYQGRQLFYEGIVLERSKKAKKIKVKLIGYPSTDKGIWVRMTFQMASNDTQLGAMPSVNAHVILMDISPANGTQFSNMVFHSCVYDENNVAPTEDNTSKDDTEYFCLKTKNGDKIEMYISNEDNKNIINIRGGGNVVVYADDQVNVIAQRVRIGTDNEANTEEVVLKSHLAKYDAFVDEMSTFINNLLSSTWVDGLLGILPFSAISPAFSTQTIPQASTIPLKKDNDTNISSITKIDKK